MPKIAHWVWQNNSGMARVAESLAAAEKTAGLDSVLVNVMGDVTLWDAVNDADVHVVHTHLPDAQRRKLKAGHKVVYVAHGTPEHIFKSAVESGLNKGYGHSDSWMLTQNWIRTADATVTFWPRHAAWWQSICDRRTMIACVPLGVDKTYWQPMATQGKFAGQPSLFTAENCHDIKWPLDLFVAWPWVWEKINPEARLHAAYLPNNQHRWFFPLVNRNGASYSAHITGETFDHARLRNAFCSVDYYVGLVRYGDFNRVCLEANACGCRTISYRGNEYADFWVTEGDQRVIAAELVEIIEGRTAPRAKSPVPDISETAEAMKAVYERL